LLVGGVFTLQLIRSVKDILQTGEKEVKVQKRIDKQLWISKKQFHKILNKASKLIKSSVY